MSNLPTSLRNSKRPEPPNPYIMGGSTRNSVIQIDTLVLNLYLQVSDYGKELFPNLENLKNHLQSTEHEVEALFEFGPGSKYFKWNLQRIGAKFYPYMLKCGDITLMLSERDEDSTIPSARLQIGSLTSQDSVRSTYDDIKAWLSIYGLKVVRDQVSRVDICHDFRLNIRDKRVMLYDDDRCVCKARDSAQYRSNRKITGVQYGKGDIVLRIYDKLLEIQKPHNVNKLDFFMQEWKAKLKPNQEVHNVTRVEFQLRKGVLNQLLQLGSFHDFLKNMVKIWAYLTTDWFRHSSRVIDRENRNQDKAAVSFFWKTVQQLANIPEKALRSKKKLRFKPIEPLLAQVRGLLVSICAGLGHDPTDEWGMFRTVSDIAADQIGEAMKDSNLFQKKFSAIANNYELTF